MSRYKWLTDFVHPLMVGGMLGTIAFAFVAWVKPFFPASWNPAYLIVGCILLALEAAFFNHLTQIQREETGDPRRITFALEFLVIVIGLRLARYLGRPISEVMQAARGLISAPASILDLEFIVALTLGLVSWGIAMLAITYLHRVNQPEDLTGAFAPPMAYLSRRFYAGGVLLMLPTGAVGLFDLAIQARTYSVDALVLNALLYFLLGLALLSQIQFMTLEYRWEASGAEVPPAVASRWLRYSMVLLALALAVAIVLPTGRSKGLLNGIASVIARLMQPEAEQRPAFMGVTMPTPFPGSEPGAGDTGFDELAGAPSDSSMDPLPTFETPQPLISWTVMLLLGGMVLLIFLADRPEIVARLHMMPLRRFLRWLWDIFWHWLLQWRRVLRERLAVRPTAPPAPRRSNQPGFSFFRLGALSPRERIVYYYLSILRRAHDAGVGRSASQTPYEYAQFLKRRLAEGHKDLDALTAAFIEARYSPASIDAPSADRVEGVWKRVKAALRRLTHPRASDS